MNRFAKWFKRVWTGVDDDCLRQTADALNAVARRLAGDADRLKQMTYVSAADERRLANDVAAAANTIERIGRLHADARRYRFLRERFAAADFNLYDEGKMGLVFEMTDGMRVSPDLDRCIDEEMQRVADADNGIDRVWRGPNERGCQPGKPKQEQGDHDQV